MNTVNRLRYVRKLCDMDMKSRGVLPSQVMLDDMARTVCDTLYDPRHVPSLLGAVAITRTHVCITDADSESVDSAAFWWWRGLWRNGHPVIS